MCFLFAWCYCLANFVKKKKGSAAVLYTACIENACTISGASFRTQKQGQNFVSFYVPKHLVFEVQPPRSPDFSPVDFYLWGTKKSQVYSAPIENEETFHQHVFLCV